MEIFTSTGNRKSPKYPVYWDFLVDCLAPFPGLRGLTVGASHVDTPESAGGVLRGDGGSPDITATRPSKKQKIAGSRKKGSAETPLSRVCNSIETLIGKMGSRDNSSEVTFPAVQGQIDSLRSDISTVTSKVDSLAAVVSELVQHLRSSTCSE